MFEAPPAPVPLAEAPPAFSIERREPLPDFRVERRCDPNGAEILVCGRRGESAYRLPPMPPAFDAALDPVIPFGVDVGQGMRLGPTVSQVTLPGGFISQRVMMTLRTRF
ncbi:MAG: hypothetical protein AB7O91_05210 [Sphingomonas sp.]